MVGGSSNGAGRHRRCHGGVRTEGENSSMTGNAIERASRLALATGMSDDRINLVAQLVAPGANRLELANFLAFCVARGLDPLAKQAYFIKYAPKSPGSIVVGIDGERATADSTGEYAGSDEPVFEYDKIDNPPP